MNVVTRFISFVNQPLVKEGVKNVAGSITFIFGVVEIYNVCQILRGREISTETANRSWQQVANKIVIVFAKFSLILSAAVSRPGVALISTLVGRVFSPEQLAQIFGPNTIYAINPRHPRHIASFAAVIFALPAMAQLTFRCFHWTFKKIQHDQNHPEKNRNASWLTDSKIRLMALFNTMTSRPILHLGNQLGRYILRYG
jgi:hypothetical protein